MYPETSIYIAWSPNVIRLGQLVLYLKLKETALLYWSYPFPLVRSLVIIISTGGIMILTGSTGEHKGSYSSLVMSRR
jgi:hypothetical protein